MTSRDALLIFIAIACVWTFWTPDDVRRLPGCRSDHRLLERGRGGEVSEWRQPSPTGLGAPMSPATSAGVAGWCVRPTSFERTSNRSVLRSEQAATTRRGRASDERDGDLKFVAAHCRDRDVAGVAAQTGRDSTGSDGR